MSIYFVKGKGGEVRLHPERNQVYRCLVQNQKRGKTSRSKKKGGDNQSKTKIRDGEDPNRHGLLGTVK